MVVDAGSFRYIPFTVADAGRIGIVTGRFQARGGSNDIRTLIISADEMANFQAGAYKAFYNSGYIQTADISLKLAPGSYFLIFDNRKALILGKTVYANFQLHYE